MCHAILFNSVFRCLCLSSLFFMCCTQLEACLDLYLMERCDSQKQGCTIVGLSNCAYLMGYSEQNVGSKYLMSSWNASGCIRLGPVSGFF